MVLRAIAMPVVEIMNGTWEEFRVALRQMWATTTQAANWMMTELYARDVRRTSEPKLLPMPRVYLYPEARARFPQLPSASIAALEQATQAKYRAKRYEVIWTCSASLATYRYPTPFSVPNQGWSVELVNERPVVGARMGEREGRWKLRLKSNPRFRRQLEAVRLMTAGAAERGSLDLYQQMIDGKPQVMCKLVAWLPRIARSSLREGTLSVRTAADSLLVAVNEKDEKLWSYHADQVRRWSEEHRKQLQRWADDSKFEQGPVPAFTQRREEAAAKYRARMNSAVQPAGPRDPRSDRLKHAVTAGRSIHHVKR
jgi:hypothetical protein